MIGILSKALGVVLVGMCIWYIVLIVNRNKTR